MPQQSFPRPQGEVETAYQQAGEHWDRRLGSARVQAASWRFFALGCLALALGLGGIVLYQDQHFAEQQSRLAGVVEIACADDGRWVTEGRALLKPSRASLQDRVRTFLRNTRGLVTDPTVVRERWLKAYGWVTPQAKGQLDEFARQRNPFERVGKEQIMVEITRLVPRTETSFDVDWRETTYDMKGNRKETKAYSGYYSLELRPPKDEKERVANALGIWILSINVGS
jgi:type IV secretion system protein TrbF